MRNYRSGLIPILTLLTTTMVARPEVTSGQMMAANTTRVTAAAPSTTSTLAFGSIAEWKSYAVRLVNEADALPAGSAEGLQKIHAAATIRFTFGEEALALDLMVKAAEAASRTDSVALAAHAYLDAAWIATSMLRPNQANKLAERAVQLTISSLMTDADRMAIRNRVQHILPVEFASR